MPKSESTRKEESRISPVPLEFTNNFRHREINDVDQWMVEKHIYVTCSNGHIPMIMYINDVDRGITESTCATLGDTHNSGA